MENLITWNVTLTNIETGKVYKVENVVADSLAPENNQLRVLETSDRRRFEYPIERFITEISRERYDLIAAQQQSKTRKLSPVLESPRQ